MLPDRNDLLENESYLEKFIRNDHIDTSGIQPEVLASWQRCKGHVDPNKGKNNVMWPVSKMLHIMHKYTEFIEIAVPAMENIYNFVQGSGFSITIEIVENGKQYAFGRGYTWSGLPYYIPPPDKNTAGGYQLEEILFLPISNVDFRENKDRFFFGYRYLISNNNHSTISAMVDNPMASITRWQLQYEIMRVRFYPEGERGSVPT